MRLSNLLLARPQLAGLEFLPWNNPASWLGAGVPPADATVVIGDGMKYELNTTTNTIAALIVEAGGTLKVSDTVDSWLKAGRVEVHGTWIQGDDSHINTRDHRRTLSGDSPTGVITGFSHYPSDGGAQQGFTSTGNNGTTNDANGINRGFLVYNGANYQVNAYRPPVWKCRLAASGFAGSTQILLETAVTWRAGDEIIITRSKFWDGTHRTGRYTIASDVNDTTLVHLTTPLTEDYYGSLQYLNDNKTITTAPLGNFTLAGMQSTTNIKRVVDERSKVILISRRHTSESVDDDQYQTLRFGYHEMIMGSTTVARVRGMGVRRCGQGGRLARYPLHFHANSLGGFSGGVFTTITPVADNQLVFEDCSVYDSVNRAYTFHAVQNAKALNCSAFNILGHAFFLEEGSEKLCTWQYCDAHKVSDPGLNWRIKVSDIKFGPEPGPAYNAGDEGTGPTGFWLSNYYNHFIGCHASDCEGPGIWGGIHENMMWAGYGGGCLGLSKALDLQPIAHPPLTWLNPISHSNRREGRNSGTTIANEAHDFVFGKPQWFDSFKLGVGNDLQGTFEGDFYYKNLSGGYFNSLYNPRYKFWVVADNGNFDFHGRTQFGEIEDCTWIEETGNSEPAVNKGLRIGMVSYHGTLQPTNPTVFGYAATGTPQYLSMENRTHLWMRGWLGSFDNYLDPLYSFSKNFGANAKFTESMNMYMTPAGAFLNRWAPPFSTFGWPNGLKGRRGGHNMAFWDEYGYLFGVGARRFGLVDDPFVTYGLTDLIPVRPYGVDIGMTSTAQPMVGVRRNELYRVGLVDASVEAITFQRQHPTTRADIPGADFIMDTSVVPGDTAATNNNIFSGGGGVYNVLPKGGRVRIFNQGDFPSAQYIKGSFNLVHTNADDATWGVLEVPFPDSFVLTYIQCYGVDLTLVANDSAMLASTGPSYWRDLVNHRLVMKFVEPAGGGSFDANFLPNYRKLVDYTYNLYWG